MRISVCIGAYEMHGHGVPLLSRAILSVAEQDYPDIEIVVSDHSADYAIAEYIQSLSPDFPLVYVRNDQKRGSSSANFNNAIRNATGDVIKILCQDDFLIGSDALAVTAKAFEDPKVQWAITPYFHTFDGIELRNYHVPRLNPKLCVSNTIGTHSSLAIRRNAVLDMFDEDLVWLMDCEYYARLFDRHGHPAILDKATMANLLWRGQVTHTLADDGLRARELEYVFRKHYLPIPEATPANHEYRKAFFKKSETMTQAQQEAFNQINKLYEARCAKASDINEHLPVLKTLASECEVIVELGVRSIVSTWAFMAAKPKQLVSCDLFYPKKYINHDPDGCDLNLVFDLSEKAGIEFAFHRGDSRTFQCPRCELLFIDTLHDYAQLKAELNLHHPRALKYIVLHDTETHWLKGEDAPEGIGRAVQEFLLEHEEWKILERYTNNNGMMVLKRVK